MIEEPTIPFNDHDDNGDDIPQEIGDIISQLKLLYMIGGEETVRVALTEAGLPDEDVFKMLEYVKSSVGDDAEFTQ